MESAKGERTPSPKLEQESITPVVSMHSAKGERTPSPKLEEESITPVVSMESAKGERTPSPKLKQESITPVVSMESAKGERTPSPKLKQESITPVVSMESAKGERTPSPKLEQESMPSMMSSLKCKRSSPYPKREQRMPPAVAPQDAGSERSAPIEAPARRPVVPTPENCTKCIKKRKMIERGESAIHFGEDDTFKSMCAACRKEEMRMWTTRATDFKNYLGSKLKELVQDKNLPPWQRQHLIDAVNKTEAASKARNPPKN